MGLNAPNCFPVNSDGGGGLVVSKEPSTSTRIVGGLRNRQKAYQPALPANIITKQTDRQWMSVDSIELR
ncbi:MAG: hypothetical protein WA885_07340 [Phormidesmis sp.]